MRITPGRVTTSSSISRSLASEALARSDLLERGACRGDGGASVLSWIAQRALSDHHGVAVCRALGNGVLEALGRLFTALAASRLNVPTRVLFEQSLTVLYRILFLLFAEARGLVPMWHPVYRERYSIEAIVSDAAGRTAVSRRVAGGSGDLAAGPRRLLGRSAEGDGVQRPALRPRLLSSVRSNAH